MSDDTLTTTITGYNVSRVEAMLVEHLAEQMTKESREAMLKEARRMAQARIAETAAETVDAEVRKVLTEGWEETSTWGESTGKRFGLRAYIIEYLKTERPEAERNGYSDQPRRTPIYWAMKRALETVFSKEFEAEIEAARKTLRTQIDAAVAGKFVDTIKGALGLR